jgi:ammonia channel protein AmtB
VTQILLFQGVGTNTAWSLANYSIYAVCFISSQFAIITPALITGAFAERIRF